MTPEGFLAVLGPLTDSLGWRLRSFTRDDDFVAVAALENDPSFEQALWILNAKDATLRCLLVSRAAVAQEREGAILELCARINDGLVFGCAEYSFDDKAVIFRDSADLRHGSLAELVEDTTVRMLALGSRYASAIVATLAGSAPAEAVASAESARAPA